MARGTVKVTVKKTSNGGKKGPVKPRLSPKHTGAPLHIPIISTVKKKKKNG